ncbi:hypothetical protein MNBD_PLANCTO02-2333 [hydrothermal vent metagenome]|uniref:Uncharacterized protein n=1 Tax=hydrothermal vent metagenome TaxID=652676 RepID=A0A3B1DKK1_9ZZZZ
MKTILTSLWKIKLTRIAFMLFLVCNSLTLFAQQLFAQQQGDQTPASPVILSSRSFTFDAIIVTLFVGLALFAICKSARRS